MKGINFGRVVLGGILAGVIFNVSEFVLNTRVINELNESAMKALGKTVPQSGSVIAVWLIYGFVSGFLAVWLYAVSRPRFGAGAGTAARAGIFFWVLASLLPTIVMWNLGLFPISLLVMIWTLIEAMAATVAGAWLYKEEGA